MAFFRLRLTCMFVLSRAVMLFPKHVANYWANVAKIVKTRSAEECHNQHTSRGIFQTPTKKSKKPKKKQVEASKGPGKEKSVLCRPLSVPFKCFSAFSFCVTHYTHCQKQRQINGCSKTRDADFTHNAAQLLVPLDVQHMLATLWVV